MFKFVQSGDFHLDSPLDSFEDSDARRLLLLDSFGRVIETVKSEGAHLLLLTGDLFDNDSVRRETLQYILEQLATIPDTKVLAVPGNHDYWGSSDAWQLLEGAKNLFIFTEFESLLLESPGVIIHGAGFRGQTEPQTLLPRLASLDRRLPNFLLLHGDVAASSLYNPLNLADLSAFDYCALGHRHEYQRMGPKGQVVYAGNPCARNFLETGEKGCVLGSWDEHGLALRFVPFAFPQFHDLRLEVSDLTTHSAVRDRIRALMERPGDYYRITLVGRNALAHNLEYLASELPAGGIRIIDETRNPRDLALLRKESTLQGIYTRRMLELSAEEPLAMEALEAGLDALENEAL